MIFKVQLPMATNELEPYSHIYNEDRSIVFSLPVQDVEEWFIHHPYKIFVNATYDKSDNSFAIHEIVEDQEW